MRIGFDISQTGAGKAGCGYFAHAMIDAMLKLASEHFWSLYPSFGDFWFDPDMPKKNPYHGRNVKYGQWHGNRDESRRYWTAGNVEEALGRPDIIHANNFWCPVQLKSSRLVYTFYDMGFVVDPAWTTETNRVSCFEGVFRSSIAADWVVAISDASREHYLRTFPHFSGDRIRTIYPCSRFNDAAAAGKQPKALEGFAVEAFWLNVGTIEPRKNQHRLTQAYAKYLEHGGAPFPLVLAGGKGWLMDDFQKHLAELGITEHVIMTGYVSDDELVWLYRNCFANIYPSMFEGFGLPVLEGMQFGAPTITSNTTSIPEVAGQAALLIDPEDVEAMAQAMLQLSTDKERRSALKQASVEQAKRFEWKKSAQSLLHLYEEAVAAPKRNT